jgi:adsorption protein B
MVLDHWVANLLAPLGFWVLLNAIDDLIVDCAAAYAWLRHRAPTEEELDQPPPRPIAIFVALWQEHRVIQNMLDNNVTRIRYPKVEFFVGAYPNDAPTIAAVRAAMERFPNVHLALCPHDGPTSKADCLNWIYQRMLLYEETHGVRFDAVMTHDAEDLIHPDSLRWVNYYSQWADMVQVPVLALPTPLREISHGVYCDEFTEYQFKDMMARGVLGGFIPSCGVGTAFSRKAIEALAARNQNRVFEPGSLTEDYENGFRVHAMGMRQKFMPIQFQDGHPIATREYFPRKFSRAVRQRSRWVTGNALQTWEYHSAAETFRYAYWFWRDRKGLVGNLATPLTNILFLYGIATLVWAEVTHSAWGLGRETAALAPVYLTGLGLQAAHTAARAVFCARIYGWRFAAGVPIRAICGNWINCFATVMAIATYASAKVHRRPLRWVKTDHAYPSRAALVTDRQGLGEILVGSGWITAIELNAALSSRPEHRRLGEHLMQLGAITEDILYTALSRQNNLPLGRPETISPAVTRVVPAQFARQWRVLPFRITAGELYVATPELPASDVQEGLRRFSSLEVRFHLVTPHEFDEMAAEFLPARAAAASA